MIMSTRTYSKIELEAKHRVAIKRQLRQNGCQFDNTENTPALEETLRISNLEEVS